MQYITSLDAKNHFGRVVDSSQREPVVVTRHSRPMVAVISVAGDIEDIRLQFAKLISELKPLRGQEAVEAYRQAVQPIQALAAEDQLTEEDMVAMLKNA